MELLDQDAVRRGRRNILDGLALAEGPTVLPDGSLAFVEIKSGRLRRWSETAGLGEIADLGGGPNGAALGLDGLLYVVNNGGFDWAAMEGRPDGDPDTREPSWAPTDYRGGWIDRVNPDTGEVERLHGPESQPWLRGLNDIVSDRRGGFWATDFGKRRPYEIDTGGLVHIKGDGGEVEFEPGWALTPNGVGVAPDGQTVYVSETMTGRVVAFGVDASGRAERARRIIAATPYRLDSMAVEASGVIVVAVLDGGLLLVSPDGRLVEYLAVGDSCTNVCFGGADLQTLYVTTHTSLFSLPWPRPGLPQPGNAGR